MATLKKIYFPYNVYSKNKNDIKKIINNHNLSWIKSAMKYYGERMAGIYASEDGTKRIMCIYEGSDKPVTFIVKSLSGKFLLDLLGYSAIIGGDISDVNEKYIDKIKAALSAGGDIYDIDRKKYYELDIVKKKELDIKIDKVVDIEWDKYVKNINYNGIDLEVIEYFRRKYIKNNIISMLNHGLDHLVFAELNNTIHNT